MAFLRRLNGEYKAMTIVEASQCLKAPSALAHPIGYKSAQCFSPPLKTIKAPSALAHPYRL